MKKIYKYGPVELGVANLEIPMNAKIIHFGEQNHKFWIWCEVFPNNPVSNRKFALVGTGWELSELGKVNHIATTIGEVFVWHLYEVLEK